MFENLSLKEFTWPREPVLYLTLLVAILNIVISVITGEVSILTAIETLVGLIIGFIARGKVSPV